MDTRIAVVLLLAVSGTTISVLAPDSLKRSYPAGVPAELPTFGFVPYGGYVAGIVLPADCCGPCSAPGYNNTHPFIFLVARGGCDYATKVYFAEMAGAKAVLVYNTKASQDGDLMASADIYPTSIPSALLSSGDGVHFLEETNIVVNITFESANPRPTVNVKFVRSLDQYRDSSYIIALPAISDFGGVVSLESYFYMQRCPGCSKTDTRCICQSHYCSFESPLGGNAVREAIRQHCVFNSTTAQGNYTAYIDYMLDWEANCNSQTVCHSAEVDAASVQQCYFNTFAEGDDQAVDNHFLAGMMSEVTALRPKFFPIFIVNEEIIYGAVEIASLRRAICAHLDFQHPACMHFFCAPGCWPEMKTNLLCDAACNVEACGFDSGACLHPILLGGTNQSDENSTIDSTTAASNQTNSNQPPPSPPTTASSMQSNSTSPTSTFLGDSSTTTSYYVNDQVPKDCKCNVFQLRYPRCLPECNTAACHYQNWTCPCAPQCSLEMLQNQECDAACNTAECHHDFFSCPVVQSRNGYSSDTDSQEKDDDDKSAGTVFLAAIIGSVVGTVCVW